MIFAQLRESIKEILQCLCKYKGVEILEGHLMPDHVHMLASIPPKISVANFMGYLKGKSSLMIFDKHANLKRMSGIHLAIPVFSKGYRPKQGKVAP